jgi:2-polyprenyl-3-methyl-5-hydroxy-6-metoxy-1,4-benzoquinol methylase
MDLRSVERQYWDNWNLKHRRPEVLDEPSRRRMREVLASLSHLKIRESKILEVGCGTGWLSSKLTEFGAVTAVDLGMEVIQYARASMPEIDFRSGDFLELDLPINSFEVVVTLETLAHVSDQEKFMHKLAQVLKPGGHLILTTQNRFVFERRGDVKPNVGFVRNWVTMKTLKGLLSLEFSIERATTLEPEGHLGVLRVMNSRKINRVLDLVIGPTRVKRLKESAGLGQTLFVLAVKTSSPYDQFNG